MNPILTYPIAVAIWVAAATGWAMTLPAVAIVAAAEAVVGRVAR